METNIRIGSLPGKVEGAGKSACVCEKLKQSDRGPKWSTVDDQLVSLVSERGSIIFESLCAAPKFCFIMLPHLWYPFLIS